MAAKVKLQDHCENNSIITHQQAGGKKDVQGCGEQLLINKIIPNEVKHNLRNLHTTWLDYQKVFDSVPHSWMLKPLKLAKVPTVIIKAIEQLSHQWETILYINGNSEDIITEIIKYFRGIFQGNSFSVLLFILSVNPLSFLLNKLKGYSLGTGNNRINVTINFFVDDLKLYDYIVDIFKTVRSCYNILC